MTNVKMEIATANVESFKSIFNSINTIVDTISFECYTDRVEINCLDKSKTTFISCVMMVEYFDSYVCEDPDRFNIDTTEFGKIIKSCKDNLTLEFDTSNVFVSTGSKKFTIYQVNDDLTPAKPPAIDHPVKFEISLKYLKDMVKDIELFAKDVTINSSENQITFSTEGNMGEFVDTYTVDDEFPNKHVKLSSEKLATCLGSTKVSANINVQMDTDMPFIMLQENEGIRMMYMIAPRIDYSE